MAGMQDKPSNVRTPSQGQPTGPAPAPHASNAIFISKQKAKDRKNKIIICTAAGVIVLAIVVVLVWLFVGGASNIFDNNAQEGQAPYKTEEEIQAELDRIVDEGMFNISIASEITFEDGTSEGVAYIENVPGNRYNMQVTIVSSDNPDEVYYTSGVIKPNQYIESIKLDKDLDAGSYSATANFTALDSDTNEEIGEAAAQVTLEVKN